MGTREKQMMKKFEVDRGWDSWDSDRRRKLVVAVMIYHGQMTARDTKDQHSREAFRAPVVGRIRGGVRVLEVCVCVGKAVSRAKAQVRSMNDRDVAVDVGERKLRVTKTGAGDRRKRVVVKVIIVE